MQIQQREIAGKIIMQPILDIITVTKDDPDGVAATIRSTRKLRACPGVRQVIVDGSRGPAQLKVQELLIGEENIDYILQDPDGISQAFNLGISTSNAEWVWFLNGRDEAYPSLDVHFLIQILHASQSDIIIFEIEYMQSRLRCKHPSLYSLWPPLYWMPHPAAIIKHDLFNRYGHFSRDFKIAMDGDLWIRFFTKNIVIDMLSIPISLYDQNGLSSTEITEVHREANKIIINNFSELFRIWLRQGLYLYKALKRHLIS